MQREQFITKLIKRLSDEDWTKWLEEENQSLDSSEVASYDVFYDNLLKKIGNEMNKLKDE